MNLYKLTFRAAGSFQEKEIEVLQPHIAPIITESMRYVSITKDSSNYFLLIRELFVRYVKLLDLMSSNAHSDILM